MPLKSVRLRVVLPVGVVLVASAILSTIIGQREMGEGVARVSRARAGATSDLVLDAIEARMRSHQGAHLGRTIEKFARNPDVSTIRVLDSEGRVVVSSRMNDASRVPDHTIQRSSDGDALTDPVTGSVIHQVRPIYSRASCRECHQPAAGVIGMLDVDITTSRQASALRTWTIFSSAGGILQTGGALVVMGLAVGILILRPLRHLTALMERVRKGDLTVRMDQVGTREIDAVGSGFNAMVNQLREGVAAAEDARRLELERAQHLSTVGRLATGLAHEIRNPLSGVKAALEVLRDDMPEGEPSEILSESLAELSRIEAVVKDLLSYARPTPPLLQPSDLNALVHESAVLLEPLAAARGVHLRRALATDLPPVIVDRDMLHRVLVNLAMNAIDAVQPPGSVTLLTARLDGRVLCRVRDTGPGVAPANASRLFEPFFTTKPRGTGLGLAISRRLVENFDGRLWLENPGEPGASFAFTLPLAAAGV